MHKIGRIISAVIFAAALPCVAQAQTNPNLTQGQVLTPAQWNALFAGKQDWLGAPPLLSTGGTMTGPLITAAPTAIASGLNLPPGTPPSSPNNGDLWSTSAGLFVEINGSTIPLTGAGSGSFTATSPLAVTFPSVGIVNYAFNFAVANTFLAQQTDQGATTTQPGWFVQVAGDTVPRIHLGLTTLDVPTLSFGSGSATRDAFIQRVGPASLRIGGPDNAAAVAQTLSVQNVLAGTSNANGANFTINGSIGTGTGTGGAIIFQVASAGSSGTAQNSLSPVLFLGQAHTVVVTSPAASAFSVGLNGSVNPSFVVNDSTALQAAGLSVTGAVTGGTVSLDAIDSGSSTNIRINAKGSGAINIGNLSTGLVNIGQGGGGVTIFNSFTATGLVTLADLATGTQDTVLGYFTSTAASATAIPNCTGALTYSTSAHTIGCNASAGTGTVTTTGSPAANQVGMFTGSTAITGIAVGLTGQSLQGNTGSAPTFKSGGWSLLNSSGVQSAVSTIQDTTSFGLGYSEYEIVIEGLACGTTTSTLELQVLVGGTPAATGYAGTWLQGNGAATSSTQITTGVPLAVTGTCPATSAPGSFVKVFTYTPAVSAIHVFVGEAASSQGAGVQSGVISGQTPSAAVLSGYQILATAGTITVTNMKTYGRL